MSRKKISVELTPEQTKYLVSSLLELSEDFEVKYFGNICSVFFQDTPANQKRVEQAKVPRPPDMEASLSNRLHKLVLTHAIQDKVGDPGKKEIYDNVEEVLLKYRERIKELEGPFEKVTKLASELAADLEWARKMWAYDRSSLLENSKYWKGVVEDITEARILERGDGKEKTYRDAASLAAHREMTRPTWRAVVQSTQDEVLKIVSEALKNGTAVIEPDDK